VSRARYWTCRVCGTRWPRTKQRCDCGIRRPPARKPKHQLVLDTLPYEAWVERFGERCGICGRPPGPNRRLDRDHWHGGPYAGEPRGLLCHLCNRRLPEGVTTGWLNRAGAYLARAERAAEARVKLEPDGL
jgi:hypothetical protein